MDFKNFIKGHAGWILAGLSSLGVITTSILVANETPRVQDALDEEDDPSFMDKVRIAAPIYLPAIISGGLTIGTILGNQAMNAHQQASLMATGAIGATIAKEYSQYRQAIRAENGDAMDIRALERARMTEEQLRIEIDRLKQENGPFLYSIATMPGLIFEARPADIYDAFLHYSRNLILRSTSDLVELYEFIGLPSDCYNEDNLEKYGWCEYVNEADFDIVFMDFGIRKVQTRNGITVRMIYFPVPPYDILADIESASDVKYYPRYQEKQAEDYIRNLVIRGKDGIVEIDHPALYAWNLYL